MPVAAGARLRDPGIARGTPPPPSPAVPELKHVIALTKPHTRYGSQNASSISSSVCLCEAIVRAVAIVRVVTHILCVHVRGDSAATQRQAMRS